MGGGLEELFRFVPQLREPGVQAIISILRHICIVGGDKEETDKALDLVKEAAAATVTAAAAAASSSAATAGEGDAMQVDPNPSSEAQPAATAPQAAADGAGASREPPPLNPAHTTPELANAQQELQALLSQVAQVEAQNDLLRNRIHTLQDPTFVPPVAPVAPPDANAAASQGYDFGLALADKDNAEAHSYLHDRCGLLTD